MRPKYVIYCCYGGAHTSITCGALHAELLSVHADWRQILDIPGFDCMMSSQLGCLWYVGRYENQHIFAAGYRNHRDAAIRCLRNLVGDDAAYLFVDALVTLHPLTFVGGITSRRWGLRPGGKLAAMGIQRSLPQLWALVHQVRDCH